MGDSCMSSISEINADFDMSEYKSQVVKDFLTGPNTKTTCSDRALHTTIQCFANFRDLDVISKGPKQNMNPKIQKIFQQGVKCMEFQQENESRYFACLDRIREEGRLSDACLDQMVEELSLSDACLDQMTKIRPRTQ